MILLVAVLDGYWTMANFRVCVSRVANGLEPDSRKYAFLRYVSMRHVVFHHIDCEV